jgi:desulfoferrodoxin (superoxide reductase-like protein)
MALMSIFVLLLLATSLPVSAHEPEAMTIIYNDRLDVLTVSISHDVKDRTTHYVDRIEVYIGATQVIERTFTEQPRDNYNERFTLKAVEDDELRVVAYCKLEGQIEREMTIGTGLSTGGDRADMMNTMIYVHAALQITGLVLALVAIPGGMHFYRAWKTKTKPTGKRRRHIRIGWAVVALWGLGALGGMWIVYMTSGDYLGSPHGWMAFATFIAALFASYSASTTFRKAGYGMRMQSHVPLSLLTIVLGIVTILGGMLTAGVI